MGCTCQKRGLDVAAQAFVNVRVPDDLKKKLLSKCSKRVCSQSELVRMALEAVASDDPVSACAAALGLPAGATAADCIKALEALDAPPQSPLADAPPDPEARKRQRRSGLSPAEFERRKRATLAAMRRPR